MTFYYDGDCGFCQWSARKLTGFADVDVQPAWAKRAPVEVAPHIERFAVYVGDDVQLGHRAIAAALRNHGRNSAWRLAGRVLDLRVLSPLFAGVYRLVAMNRHKLGPLVGEEACAIPQREAS